MGWLKKDVPGLSFFVVFSGSGKEYPKERKAFYETEESGKKADTGPVGAGVYEYWGGV